MQHTSQYGPGLPLSPHLLSGRQPVLHSYAGVDNTCVISLRSLQPQPELQKRCTSEVCLLRSAQLVCKVPCPDVQTGFGGVTELGRATQTHAQPAQLHHRQLQPLHTAKSKYGRHQMKELVTACQRMQFARATIGVNRVHVNPSRPSPSKMCMTVHHKKHPANPGAYMPPTAPQASQVQTGRFSAGACHYMQARLPLL